MTLLTMFYMLALSASIVGAGVGLAVVICATAERFDP